MNYLCRWHKGGRTEMKKNKNMFLTKNTCNPKLKDVMRLWRNWQTR
ncbi:hypothetical protein CU026_2526 [Enterococcus faecium]|nr:hypothetical protein EfmE1071_1360 [Enterococcus faecium E1071]EFF22897.1 hypothetical protein EfmE1636_1947 [Enterococcus faecium E1636]EFF27687.1 hypothetical protein EfmE1679_0169 [Enterococcus faecium E1679]MBK4756377.1 hypothetical protein [Enterococcus faecium]MBK4762961.1 hypothetical protein [Enterococcus faecium]